METKSILKCENNSPESKAGFFCKAAAALLCVIILITFAPRGVFSVSAASGPSVTTTLKDGITQRGSKRTFDVFARNAAGEKIRATVKLNGKRLDPTWDDNEKASYTLLFTSEGENTVIVSAASDGGKKKELTYKIYYKKASPGEKIGEAVWSVEAFTIGCGYIVYPVSVPIYEGETSAEQLVRLINESGYICYYGGTLKQSFYLAYIADGDSSLQKYNSYIRSTDAASPKKLDLSPEIPSLLVPSLEDTMTFFDPDDYAKNWCGYLGEFAITNGSGWMYSVNNVFPNVGFADYYLSDGDVVRVQFTLGYGADIGGFGAVGDIPGVDTQPTGGYYEVADKDDLTAEICRARESGLLSRPNVKAAYQNAVSVMEKLNATQNEASSAIRALTAALKNPDPEQNTSAPDTSAADTSRAPDTVKPTDNTTRQSAADPDLSGGYNRPGSDNSGKTDNSGSHNTGGAYRPDTNGSGNSGLGDSRADGRDNVGGSHTDSVPSSGSAGNNSDSGQPGGKTDPDYTGDAVENQEPSGTPEEPGNGSQGDKNTGNEEGISRSGDEMSPVSSDDSESGEPKPADKNGNGHAVLVIVIVVLVIGAAVCAILIIREKHSGNAAGKD